MDIHNCATCKPGDAEQTDCATCKLAFLSEASKKKKIRIDDDDDYSISERLTDGEKGGNSILLLFVIGILICVAVIGFTLILT